MLTLLTLLLPMVFMKNTMIPPNALKMETLTTTAVLLKEQQHARIITFRFGPRMSVMIVEALNPTDTNVMILKQVLLHFSTCTP